MALPFPATIRFQIRDFADHIPDEGEHEAIVHAVRGHTSDRGNATFQITYHLPEAPPECDRVVDYFVFHGSNPRAVAIGRRRLLGLCRACGLNPKQDEELAIDDLIGRRFLLRIGHQIYQGSKRVRVLAHRPLP